MKRKKRKHGWAGVKGQVVSVRFRDSEYKEMERRAKRRGMTVGVYLRWLTRATEDGDGELKVWREKEDY